MTVAELQSKLGGSPELSWWQAYFLNEREDRLREDADRRVRDQMEGLRRG